MGVIQGKTFANRIYTNSSKVFLEKRVTKLYWSYGEEEIEVKDISRHYSDLNLHIETENYKAGEKAIIEIEMPNNQFQDFNIIVSEKNTGVLRNIFNKVTIELEGVL